MQIEASYHPSRDQLALIEALDSAFAELMPLSRLHRSPEEAPETWSALDELGVFGIARPEAQDGSGLGATEEALMVLGLGLQLVAPSVLATLGAVHATPAGAPPEARVAAGYVANGRIVAVEDPAADWLLLRTASGAKLLERPKLGAVREGYLWGVRLREVEDLGQERGGYDAARLLRLRLLDAAALAGLASAALDMAVAYAGIREQFGRPIGSFQAIKHQCADMAIGSRCARDQVSFAAVALDSGREDAAMQVECAFYVAGMAALENAAKNVQIHGGIGFSDEADPHLLVKRAQLLVALGGGLEAANERIAEIRMTW